MGKYVHQPGDNQYDRAAQQERHGQPAPVVAPVINQGGGGGGGGGNGWVPTPHIPKPDISLDPIAADEPVVAAGFPPFQTDSICLFQVDGVEPPVVAVMVAVREGAEVPRAEPPALQGLISITITMIPVLLFRQTIKQFKQIKHCADADGQGRSIQRRWQRWRH